MLRIENVLEMVQNMNFLPSCIHTDNTQTLKYLRGLINVSHPPFSVSFLPLSLSLSSSSPGLKSIMKKNGVADKQGNKGAKKNLKFVGVNGG